MSGPVHQAAGLLRPRTVAAATPWVAVTGGKGGVGKTVIAINIALLAARAGRRVLLVDLDPGLGNVHVHLRLAPTRTLDDVLEGRIEPTAARLPYRPSLEVLTSQSGSDRLATGDRAALRAALDAVAAAAHGFDLVVCDTGAGLGPAVLETVRRASDTLVVTTPDPAAATDAYALIKIFQREAIATPRVLVNRVTSRDHAMRTASRLSTVCERFLGSRLELAGWLHDDPAVPRSIERQTPLAHADDGRPFADLRAATAGVLSRLPQRRRAVVAGS